MNKVTINFDCVDFKISATGLQFTSILDENGNLWLVLSDYMETNKQAKDVLQLIGCNFRLFKNSLAFDPFDIGGSWYIESK